MNAALDAYRQSSVDTATPAQLVVMLYDGVVTAIDKVETALDTPRPEFELAHRELTRAQAIIMELLQTLDMSVGSVATNLAALYEYSHRQLVRSNVEKQFALAEPVRTIFRDLRDAWASLAGGGDFS